MRVVWTLCLVRRGFRPGPPKSSKGLLTGGEPVEVVVGNLARGSGWWSCPESRVPHQRPQPFYGCLRGGGYVLGQVRRTLTRDKGGPSFTRGQTFLYRVNPPVSRSGNGLGLTRDPRFAPGHKNDLTRNRRPRDRVGPGVIPVPVLP